MNTNQQSGVSLVEVIVGVALVATILVVISQVVTTYLSSVRTAHDTAIAAYQAESVLETARIIRDDDWSTFAALPLDTALYPEYTPGTAAFVTNDPTPGAQYQSEVFFRTVYRDTSTDELRSSTDSNTYVDTSARMVEVQVRKDGVLLVEQMTLLINLFTS